MKKLLAISGSLRARSSNRVLLDAAARLAAPAQVTFYDGLAGLPAFNPDLDGEGAEPPPPVRELREQVDAAGAVLISSPEYAHGVPGSLKNALDWLVSTTALTGKPVALLNASPRSEFAHPQLGETLRTMAANVVPAADVAVPLAGRRLDVDGVVADAEMSRVLRGALAAILALVAACASTRTHDLVIRGGTIYDGSGGAPFTGDVAIDGDHIVSVGPEARGRVELDARGLAVAPGFINMLSWAAEDLVEDGRSLADLHQGVTLEVFGEGWSLGPRSERMKAEAAADPEDVTGRMTFTTLGELLDEIAARGVSPNIASFVGATTIRQNVLGEDDVDPTPEQLAEMERLVDEAMREGAMGLGTSLIYAPAAFAETPELVALTRVVARHGGMYISHIRDEGDRLLEAIDELIEIARAAGTRAEIYHLKASKPQNWSKMEEAIRRVEAARAAGLAITANMYTYTASSTSLTSIVGAWAQAGGAAAMRARLRDPATRARIVAEIVESRNSVAAGGEGVLLLNFRKPELRPLVGRRLSDVARERGRSAIDTALDLMLEDESGVGVAFFTMSEDNVRREVTLPWMSFGSDGGSTAPEGKVLEQNTHPRAYGNFARLLGHYVRDEKLVPLPEAIRRLTTLPATNLRLDRRGALRAGYFADVVVFDPATIRDLATFDRPHQLATGVRDVLVNGVPVLRDGKHTGAKPGRVVRGPGWRGN